jgi:hypothetical protein
MRFEQLLEAEAIINGNKILIINTEMNISVQYDNTQVLSVYGHFSYVKDKKYYTTKTTVKFTSDKLWKHHSNKIQKDNLPESALIDFDNKEIKIQFS